MKSSGVMQWSSQSPHMSPRNAFLGMAVLRRDDTNVAKHVTTMTVGGKRPRGRPKLRWMDRVQSDLRHHQLDPKLAQDREAWINAVMAIDPGRVIFFSTLVPGSSGQRPVFN